MSEEFREKGILLAKEFSQKIAEGILIEDKGILDKFISQLFQSKDVKYVFIYSESGLRLAQRVLYEGIEDLPPSKADLDYLEIEESLVGETHPHTMLDISTPVLYESKRVGYIRLGICLEKIDEEVNKRILNSSILVVIFIFIGLVICFFFSRSFSKPISQLVEGVKKIGQGNLNYHVKVHNKDEVGELAVAFNHMIGRLSESDDKLKKYTQELEAEVEDRKKRTAELSIAKGQAEAANQAKSEFLANMSHELRTPLNHIMGFTELVVDKSFGDLNEIQEEYLGDVLHSSKHLLSLIEDILDLSKVEAGKLGLEPTTINLKEVLENSLMIIKEKAMKHGIELSIDMEEAPETVTADERKLKQILYNLLSNAVKFTPDGGEVCLTGRMVDCTVRSGLRKGDPEDLKVIEHRIGRNEATYANRKKCIEISISDTGIGMMPEDLERIFGAFEQVENSASRRFQGTGLGLSLTRQLVKLHGGRIWAESEGEGKGSTFWFVIPVQPTFN